MQFSLRLIASGQWYNTCININIYIINYALYTVYMVTT